MSLTEVGPLRSDTAFDNVAGMKNTLFAWFAPAALLVLAAAPASASTFTPTSAQREVKSRSYIYDSWWREATTRLQTKTSSALGSWEDTASTTLTVPFQHTEGDAYQVSDIGGELIYSEIYANSSAYDYDAGTATADNRGSFNTTFTLASRARVSFWTEIGAWGNSPAPVIEGAVSFKKGASTLLSRSIDDFGGDDGFFYGYLQAGTYSISASTRAELTGTQRGDYPDGPETASSYLIVYMVPYCLSDFDLDASVTSWDLSLYQDSYSANDLAADVDGDGDVDAADLAAFQAAYNSGC